MRKTKQSTKVSHNQHVTSANGEPKNPGGRPRTNPDRLPLYASMKECCAKTGIPEWLLKQAKTGCADGFRWNRVDLNIVLPWIFAEGLKTSDFTAMREKYQALNEQLKHEKASGVLIERLPVLQTIHAAESQLWGALDRCFVTELPPRVEGKTAAQVSKIAVKTLEDAKRMFLDKLEHLKNGIENNSLP